MRRVVILASTIALLGCGRVGFSPDDAGAVVGDVGLVDTGTSMDSGVPTDGAAGSDATSDVLVEDSSITDDVGTRDSGGVDAIVTDSGSDVGTRIDAGPCPAVCTGGCSVGECAIVGARSSATVTCPPGWNCRVDCDLTDSCAGIIDGRAALDVEVRCEAIGTCSDQIWCGGGSCRVRCREAGTCSSEVLCGGAADCEVRCEASGACASEIRCGVGPCSIDCSGVASCGRIDCAASCACDVACSGAGSCASAACTAGCVSASGCDSSGAGCDTCP